MLRCCYKRFTISWRVVPNRVHYDMCVIGAGPAGIAAALRAVDYKKKVCLIEQQKIGGRDLWNGTLQSKTLWEFSNLLSHMHGSRAKRLYGEPIDTYMEVDETRMRASVDEVSRIREKQIRAALDATNVHFLQGQATFKNDKEVQCHNHDTKEYQCVTADYFVIATGSSPRVHPFVPVDGKLVVTSDHIMQLPLPKSLVVVGAGVLGCELASILASLGRTKVFIIDKAARILPDEDADVVESVQEQMEKAGICIHHDSMLYNLQPWEEDNEEMNEHPESPQRRCGVQYTIINHYTKKLTTFNVDQALVSIGREPNYHGLGLENTTLKTRDGKLVVEEFGCCANSEHIYAVGDAAAGIFRVNIAKAQAKLAVDHIYSTQRLVAPQLAYTTSIVGFLTKVIAAVGLNEMECRKRNIAYTACKYGYNLTSRVIAASSTSGFIKIIVSNDPSRYILGVRGVGMNASTLVDLGALAIQKNQTAYDLADRLTAYPSLSQAFQECLRVILGRSELKPGVFESLTLTHWTPDHYKRGGLYQEEERAQNQDAGNTPNTLARKMASLKTPTSESPLKSG